MKKAVSARCTLVGSILLTLALSAWGAAADSGAPAPKTPLASPAVYSSTVSTKTKADLANLLAQGARAYKSGQFDEAVEWYKAASQLDPSDEVMQKLQTAMAMRDKRTKALASVPADQATRKQFLDKCYQEAKAQFDAGQYEKASNSLTKIWLVAGNYNNNTVEMLDSATRKMAATPKVQPAGAPAVPVTLAAASARPVSPAQPSSLPVPNSAAAPVRAQVAVTAPAPQEARPATAKLTIFDPEPAAAPAPAAARIQPIEPVAYEPQGGPVPDETIKVDLKAMHKTEAPAAAPAPAASVSALTRLQVDHLLGVARDLNAAGKPAEARVQVNKALEQWPDSPEAKALAADLDKQLGAGAAPASAAAGSKKMVETYLNEGDALAAEGKFDQAAQRYAEALKLDPSNADAAARKAKTERLMAKNENVADLKNAAAGRRTIDQLHDQASKALEAKDLKTARETWQRILQLDPQNKRAQISLDNTKADWERFQADQAVRTQAEKLSEQAEKLLSSPISISTEQRIPLEEFIKNVSACTSVDMDYTINSGAKAMVFGNFQNKSLREVLDTVLLPIGLSWSINDKNVIVIDQKLITRTYTLSPGQMSKVRALDASGDLKKNVWGQTEPPSEGCSITLDERQNMMVITGSSLHIQRVESLLPTLQANEAQEMVVRIYKINEKDGPRIKSLINSIISATEGNMDMERKIFIDKDDLIVRDTPDNIKKIEELLLDKKFIQDMTKQKLDIANFSLIPRETETLSELHKAFIQRVVNAIEVFLYGQDRKSKAAEEGRRMWFDDYTMQLTIVDTPANLARVSQYIDSLPELGEKTHQEVVFLTYAVAEDLASNLERIMDITTGGGAGGGGEANGGNEIVFQLRQGEEKQWRDLTMRLIRVRDPFRQNRSGGGGGGNNGQQDRTQGTAEFSIDTGYQNQQRSMQVMTSDYMDNYRITLEEVSAQGGNSGMGRARFRIAYVPQAQRNAMNSLQSQTMGDQEQPQAGKTLDDAGISINPFGELNALIIRYKDVKLYQDVLDLINQLDKPMNQVSIETKFVEVNETRAKEFSADFDVAGLGTGQGSKGLDWNTSRYNTRFAQDSDEFRDIFGPPVENPLSANLIKGTTVLNAVIGNQNPLLNFSLRFLEAEGVLNIVNGPRVTSLDGQEANFSIELMAPSGSSSSQISSSNSAVTFNVVNPSTTSGGGGGMYLQDSNTGGGSGLINGVSLRVTPEITSSNSIILNDLAAELIDYETWLGEVASVQYANTAASSNPSIFSVGPQATINSGENMLVSDKRIETNARVNNGGTIILGGWTSERSQELTSGVPILRNMPYIGKLLFSRNQRSNDRTTLMIFLTCYIVE